MARQVPSQKAGNETIEEYETHFIIPPLYPIHPRFVNPYPKPNLNFPTIRDIVRLLFINSHRYERLAVCRGSTASTASTAALQPLQLYRSTSFQYTALYNTALAKAYRILSHSSPHSVRLTPSLLRRSPLSSSRHYRLKTIAKRIFSRCRALPSGWT